MSSAGPTQLLVFGFDEGAEGLEGRIGGALERAESGGAIRILRLFFAGRDASTGEFEVTDLHGETGGVLSSLLSFRLDPRRRRETSAKTLERDSGERGLPAALLSELEGSLEPGTAIVAVLVEHKWHAELADAAARGGGRALGDETAGPGEDPDFAGHLLTHARARA